MVAIKKDVVQVTEIMTANPYTLSLKNSLETARNKFKKFKVRHLPVVDDEKLIGIISLNDIMRLSFGVKFGATQYEADEAIFEMLTIDEVMKHQPRTVNSTDTIRQVAEILAEEEFHALPVVENDKLVGIVTTTDVIRYLLDHS